MIGWRGCYVRSLVWTLGAIILAHHPRPDVRGTIAKDNTSSSFVLSQEVDGVTIGEDQIGKVQDNDATSRLVVD